MVQLHDGSYIQLRKLEEEYDPTSRLQAMTRLEQARQKEEMITGLLYIDPERPSLAEISNLGEIPLAQIPEEKLRPPREALAGIMNTML